MNGETSAESVSPGLDDRRGVEGATVIPAYFNPTNPSLQSRRPPILFILLILDIQNIFCGIGLQILKFAISASSVLRFVLTLGRNEFRKLIFSKRNKVLLMPFR